MMTRMMKKMRPSIISTIGKSFIKSLYRPTPLWVHLYVTRHCNFDCKYCGAKDNQRKDPSFKEICDMILKVKSLGCNCIALMGGEPTLRKDIVDIVKFCSKNNIYTQLSTNGSLLINPACNLNGKSLLENLTSAGLGTINLSVDSVTSDYDPSKKELPKASRVLEALIDEKNKNGLIVMLNCVITRQNIKQVPLMLEFCQSKNIMMAAIFVQDPKPSKQNQKKNYMSEILFSEKDAEEVCRMTEYLIEKKKKGCFLLEPIEYYKAIQKWIKNDPSFNWDCDGGKYILEIDTDGKVGICGYLPYLDIRVFELDKNFFNNIKQDRENFQKWCTQKCLPSCMFCSSFYRSNPIKFLYYKIRYG